MVKIGNFNKRWRKKAAHKAESSSSASSKNEPSMAFKSGEDRFDVVRTSQDRKNWIRRKEIFEAHIRRTFPTVSSWLDTNAAAQPKKPVRPDVATDDSGGEYWIDQVDGDIYQAEISQYAKTKVEWEKAYLAMFACLFTHITPGLMILLQKDPNFKTVKENSDVVGLYKILNNKANNDPSKFVSCNPILGDLLMIKEFDDLRMTKDENIGEFYKRFKEAVLVLESLDLSPIYRNVENHADKCITEFPDPPPLDYTAGDSEAVKAEKSRDHQEQMDAAEQNRIDALKERTIALLFLQKVDQKRFEAAISSMHERDLNGHDEYPRTLEDMYKRLVNGFDEQQQQAANNKGANNQVPNEKAAKTLFTQNNKDKKGTKNNNGSGKPKESKSSGENTEKCEACGKTNHTTIDCYMIKKVDEYRKKQKEGKNNVAFNALCHNGGFRSSNSLLSRSMSSGVIDGPTETTNTRSWDPQPTADFTTNMVYDSSDDDDSSVEFSSRVMMTTTLDEGMLCHLLSNVLPNDKVRKDHTEDSDEEENDENGDTCVLSKKFVGLTTDASSVNDIYMDSGSQCNITPHRHLLRDIERVETPLRIFGVVEGSQTLAYEAGYIGPMQFYYCDKVPVTVLSLSKCSKMYKITLDTSKYNGFRMYTTQGICEFKRKQGCFVHNLNEGYKRLVLATSVKKIVSSSPEAEVTTAVNDNGIIVPELLKVSDDTGVKQSLNDPNQLQKPDKDATIEDVTVREFADKLTSDEKKRMKKALEFFFRCGIPSMNQFRHMLVAGALGTDVQARDWDNYRKVYGTPAVVIKGRMTRHAPPSIHPIDLSIKSTVQTVTLYGDIMFICDFIHFVTISDELDYIMVTEMSGKGQISLNEALEFQVTIYKNQGYQVTELFFDSESGLKALAKKSTFKAAPICNIRQANRGDHVPKVERCIRTIKERVRAIGLSLEFNIGEVVLRYLIRFAVNCINVFPKKGKRITPYELLHGRRLDFKLFTRAGFGQHYLIPLAQTITNKMEERACAAICLGPAFDVATPGTFTFYTLHTGKIVQRTQCFFQGMNDLVIQKMNKLTKDSYYKEFFTRDAKYMLSTDDMDTSSSDEEDDAPRHPQVVHPVIQREILAAQSSNNVEATNKRKLDTLDTATPTTDAQVYITNGTSHVILKDNVNCRGESTGATSHNSTQVSSNVKRLRVLSSVPLSTPTTNESTTEVVSSSKSPSNGFSSLSSFPCDKASDLGYDPHEDLPIDENDVLLTFESPLSQDAKGQEPDDNTCYMVSKLDDDHDPNDLIVTRQTSDKKSMTLMTYHKSETSKLKVSPFIVPMAMILITMASQLSVKKAITLYPDDAVPSICKELQQLVDKDVFVPIDYDGLHPDDKKIILRTLMFVKLKRDGITWKARLCMDGRLQALYITEDYGSPTVSTESVMATAAIDAHEQRVVVCVDIEGAYLAVNMEDNVYGMFDGVVSAILCRMYPEYTKYLRRGKLYFRLIKALYGCVQSALLFYKHLRKTLEDFGFIANPYDTCVFTRDFNGKQCTICTHVDDLKISCVDANAVEAVIQELTRVYKKIAIHRERVLDYLGMELDYTTPGKVKISMTRSIEATLKEHDVNSKGNKVTSPASTNLFNVDKNASLLNKSDRDIFHSLVAKLLYIAKHGRPDILLAISFLTTRVLEPTTQDQTKLERVLQYLNDTKELKLTLEVGNMCFVDAYIDASFATHDDMKGQTGTFITLGKGAIFARSAKQKIVCKSSTESELVGLTESLTPVIWLRNFLCALGYSMEASTVHQDNQSTIMLADKGRSTSQRTRHMNIKYFYVKDYLERKEIKIKYTPTEDMVADFFTKPLQGFLFLKFRNIVMNSEIPPQ